MNPSALPHRRDGGLSFRRLRMPEEQKREEKFLLGFSRATH
jgi:hypothetical protein